MSVDLRVVNNHYGFGANWKDYLKNLDEAAVKQATVDFSSLVPEQYVQGKDVIDIGSGSGLHSLAAIRLGARSVLALDIDRDSVDATSSTLAAFASGSAYRVIEKSILDDDTSILGQFDLVYSWGVLHHTGAMWDAIDAAAKRVKPGGIFALAIYRRTPLCWMWRIEKRVFTNAGKATRSVIRAIYTRAYKLGLRVTGRDPKRYIEEYNNVRGMNFYNDIDDWLGGYPYESATEAEIEKFLGARGFTARYIKPLRPRLGLFGTGCAEFRFEHTG
jgi:2-polyprenyl-3-methyl-5-hydroxy-6-metoxy-1,4-benzoquinol methylase